MCRSAACDSRTGEWVLSVCDALCASCGCVMRQREGGGERENLNSYVCVDAASTRGSRFLLQWTFCPSFPVSVHPLGPGQTECLLFYCLVDLTLD